MKLIKKICFVLTLVLSLTCCTFSMAACDQGGQLAQAQNITIDLSTATVSFDAVKNATRYMVRLYTLDDEGNEATQVYYDFTNSNSTDKVEVKVMEDATNLNWGKYKAEVQAICTSNPKKYPASELSFSPEVQYNTLGTPQFRIVKTRNGEGKAVHLEINPKQFFSTYVDTQSVPKQFDIAIYNGEAATGTPAFTKTITTGPLDVLKVPYAQYGGQTLYKDLMNTEDIIYVTGGYNTSMGGRESCIKGIGIDVSDVINTIGSKYTITVQAKALEGGVDSAVKTMNYTYTAHGDVDIAEGEFTDNDVVGFKLCYVRVPWEQDEYADQFAGSTFTNDARW